MPKATSRWRARYWAGPSLSLSPAVSFVCSSTSVPGLRGLLSRLDLDEEGVRYVGRILAAFGGGQADAGDRLEGHLAVSLSENLQPLPEPLTQRELLILSMLADRLRNHEISDRLFISQGTVKRHNENIYHKLGVHGRREAVAKAQALGILKKN